MKKSCWALVTIALVLASRASAQTTTFVDKWLPSDLRVVSYNVLWNRIFPDYQFGKAEEFSRVVNALKPDVLNLQEITRSANSVASLMDAVLPLTNGERWHTYKRSDNVIVSRFPLTDARPFGTGAASAAVDLPDAQFEKDLFVVNDHLPCCFNEPSRQTQADRYVGELADARTLAVRVI